MAENNANFDLLEKAITLVSNRNDKQKPNTQLKCRTARVVSYDNSTFQATVCFVDDNQNNEYILMNKSDENLEENDTVKVYYTTNVAKGWIGARMGEPKLINASSGGSGDIGAGTLSEYNVLSDNSVKYNGITYTVERAESGLISKISNDIGGEFSPTFSDGVTDIEMHNAAFLAVAMMCLNKSILIEPVIYVSFDGDMTNAGTDSNITVTFKGDTPIYADGYGGAKCLSATTHTLFAINGCGSYLNKDFTLLYRFKLNDTGLSPYYGLRRMIWCNYLGKHLAGMEIGFTGSADTSAVSTNKVNFEFTMHPSLYGQTNRADGEWHTAVVRRNGSSLSFWVDDEHLEGTFPSDTIQEPMYISGTNDIKTVDDFSSEGLSLNGYIQDLKLYDKALSDGEIAMALSAKT